MSRTRGDKSMGLYVKEMARKLVALIFTKQDAGEGVQQ